MLRLLQGWCPRCEKAKLFSGLIALKPHCPACGLDVTAMDLGDAAVYPAIVIGGVIIGGIVIALEFSSSPPPLWSYGLIVPITSVVMGVALSRLCRALFLRHGYTRSDTPKA